MTIEKGKTVSSYATLNYFLDSPNLVGAVFFCKYYCSSNFFRKLLKSEKNMKNKRKLGQAIIEYVDMLDAAARKEPYNNNEVRFKADAKEVFYSIQHLLYVWICHLNHIIKVENFLLIFPHLRKTKKFTNIFIVQNAEIAEIT